MNFQTFATTVAERLKNAPTSEIMEQVQQLNQSFAQGVDEMIEALLAVLSNRMGKTEFSNFCKSLYA